MGNCLDKITRFKFKRKSRKKYTAGNVHAITTMECWDAKLAEATKDGKIVVVNFSVAWSDPCKVIAPIFSELSIKYPSLIFLMVDIDQLPELSSSWDLHATPTFFFFKDGQHWDKIEGADQPVLEKTVVKFATP